MKKAVFILGDDALVGWKVQEIRVLVGQKESETKLFIVDPPDFMRPMMKKGCLQLPCEFVDRKRIGVGRAARFLGVTVKTVQRWDEEGKLPAHRTTKGHRCYTLDQLRGFNATRGSLKPRRTRGRTEVEVPF